MRVAYAFLAEAVDFSPGLTFNCLNGDMKVMESAGFPVRQLTMVVLAKLVFPPSDAGRRMLAQLFMEHPDGNDVRVGAGMWVTCSDVLGSSAYAYVMFQLGKVIFPTPGEYNFRIDLDGAEVARLPLVLKVSQGPQPGAAGQ